eukprot:10443542-Lingulodinium_polyedra.AAC.1
MPRARAAVPAGGHGGCASSRRRGSSSLARQLLGLHRSGLLGERLEAVAGGAAARPPADAISTGRG